MCDVGRFHFLGFIVSRDSFKIEWEMIQPAKEGKLEVSYRWFRTYKDAEDWCMRNAASTMGRVHPSLGLDAG